METCPRCKRDLRSEDFPPGKGRRRATYCRDCKREYDREYYARTRTKRTKGKRSTQAAIRDRNRKYILEYLKSHSCTDCNETDPVVLEFHHVCPKDKIDVVSRFISHSLIRLQKEIQKCIILCANCHRRRTAKEFNWYKETWV